MTDEIPDGGFQAGSSTPEVRDFQLGNDGLGDFVDSVNWKLLIQKEK
ncbi:MAG: hypothetical protein PVH61_11925 [Candidatus Aminicenantes bacterium]|jgi:hypothetical protein